MLRKLLLLGIVCCSSVSAATDEELIKLSFYRGFILWKDQLRRPQVPYDIEQVIAGMRAAESGEAFPLKNEEELESLVRQMQQRILDRQITENLANAQKFLAAIKGEKGTVEVIKDKLYVKCLQEGAGDEVKAKTSPMLKYDARVLEMEGEEDFVPVQEPVKISIAGTILGFQKGVVGMRAGERRRIYIHPDLAYGKEGGFVGPNKLMIFDVDVVSLE